MTKERMICEEEWHEDYQEEIWTPVEPAPPKDWIDDFFLLLNQAKCAVGKTSEDYRRIMSELEQKYEKYRKLE